MRRAHMTLRPARLDDAAALLRWRNDPDAVRFSTTGRTVRADEHAGWLAARLSDPNTRLWIAEKDSAAVGQVRVDMSNGIGTVSITVAPERRGHGLGTQMLRAVLAVAADGDVTQLRALVRPENIASRVSFERAGFQRAGEAEGGFDVLEWRAGR